MPVKQRVHYLLDEPPDARVLDQRHLEQRLEEGGRKRIGQQHCPVLGGYLREQVGVQVKDTGKGTGKGRGRNTSTQVRTKVGLQMGI